MNRIALAILAAGTLSAHANLIQNGSFENNGSNLNYDYGLWQTYNSITGWSNTGLVEVQNNGLYGSATVAADGTKWLELDSHASYSITSQSFPAVVGQLYTVSFAYAGRPNVSPSENVMKVNVNGAESIYSAAPSALPNGALNWVTASFNFTATGSDYISFFDGGPSNSLGILLDNVKVEVAAVPEPTTLGLFGLGLLALAGAARVRSKRKA